MNFKFIRRIHSIAGLVLLVWILMYCFSGYVMMHQDWFPHGTPKVETRTEPLDWAGDKGAPAFVGYLEKTYGLQGKVKKAGQIQNGSWRFVWHHPREEQVVLIPAGASEVTITRTSYGFSMMTDRLHRFDQYDGSAKYDLWALLLDITAVAMIVFVLTGVYLWWKTTQAHFVGWICLLGSFSLTVATFVYLVLVF